MSCCDLTGLPSYLHRYVVYSEFFCHPSKLIVIQENDELLAPSPLYKKCSLIYCKKNIQLVSLVRVKEILDAQLEA